MNIATFPRHRVSMMSGPVMEGHIATPPPRVIGPITVPMSGSTWCSGSSIITRRSSVNMGTTSATLRMFAIRLLYDSITPFGEPVVPEVYIIMAHSSPISFMLSVPHHSSSSFAGASS